jgi:flagellar hook-basal body complex protein FliE
VTIEAIPLLEAANPIQATQAAATTATDGAAAPGFGKWFVGQLEQVNGDLVASQKEVQGLALGDAQNLHHVMIKLEETKLAFQLAVQVRTRLLEAYQEIMRMQI